MRVVVAGCGFGVDGVDDIGIASARAFAAEGADVIFVQPTLAAAKDVALTVTRTGGMMRALAADPRSTTETIAVTEAIAESWDSLDVLVMHHLHSFVGGIEATSLETWDEILRVNLTTVFLLARGLIPLLRRSGRGAIVIVGSIDGTHGNPNLTAYTASKGGINALTHALAGELADSGIRVNCAAQTATTESPMSQQGFDAINDATPQARAGRPEETAAAALFLASPESSYLTGVVLPVDGGRSAVTPGTAPGYAGYRSRL